MNGFTSQTWTPTRTAQLKAMWLNNSPLANISHHLGVSPSAAMSKIFNMNLPPRKKSAYKLRPLLRDRNLTAGEGCSWPLGIDGQKCSGRVLEAGLCHQHNLLSQRGYSV